jgi:hypothetical protein
MVNRLLRKNQHDLGSVSIFEVGVSMPAPQLPITRTKLCSVLMLVSALALGACQSRQAKLETDPLATGSTSMLPKAADVGSFTRTEALSKQWAANGSDAAIGLDYAENLGKMGQTDNGRSPKPMGEGGSSPRKIPETRE